MMKAIPADARHETWDSVHDLSLELATRIETDCRQRQETFDAMVVVPRGSYYPANIVARELGFESIDMLHACVGSYSIGDSQRQPTFQLGQMPPPEMVRDKNLLIIEEVCDSGQTLRFLVDWLQKAGAKLIRVGVLHYKPNCNQTDFVPDWYVAETDKWIVYPWETHETAGRQSRVRRR